MPHDYRPWTVAGAAAIWWRHPSEPDSPWLLKSGCQVFAGNEQPGGKDAEDRPGSWSSAQVPDGRTEHLACGLQSAGSPVKGAAFQGTAGRSEGRLQRLKSSRAHWREHLGALPSKDPLSVTRCADQPLAEAFPIPTGPTGAACGSEAVPGAASYAAAYARPDAADL